MANAIGYLLITILVVIATIIVGTTVRKGVDHALMSVTHTLDANGNAKGK